MDELSNNIRKLRFNNGEITQKQLAERIGISRQTMNAIENGHHAPRIDTAIRIADVLGISVDQLFDYRYDGKPENAPVAVERAIEPHEPVRERPAEVNQRVSVDNNDGSVPDTKEIDETSLAMLRGLVGH